MTGRRAFATGAAVWTLAATLAASQGGASGPPPPQTSPSSSSSSSTRDWVVYTTEIGWLRIGSRAEYQAKWTKKDEINGGTSTAPLEKLLIVAGFESREAALDEVCNHLSKVQLRVVPPAAGGPVRYLTGIYLGREYSLRLTKGFTGEDAGLMQGTLATGKALEYDWEAEWAALRAHHITPRYVFSRPQWFMHFTGHGTVNGPVKEDRWGSSTSRPVFNARREAAVTLPDGYGGTITSSVESVEGPFLDNYALARVMKRYHVDKVDLWPPVTSAFGGRDVQPNVDATKMPDETKEQMKDYGDAALPVQPLSPNKALEDWVIYSVEGAWLHVGTRYEFNLPLPKSDVIWAGTSAQAAVRTILSPAPGARDVFHSRKQALRALVAELTSISYSFNPVNTPRETVTAMFRGTRYHLRIDRGEFGDMALEGPRGPAYDLGGNIAALREINPNITPKKTFRQQWLVHATGHGTYSGSVKDDMWMMIGSAPDAARRGFTVPDGMGGTFGYSYDRGGGPFTDSYALIAAIRTINDPRLTSIGLVAEDRGVSIADIPDGVTPIDQGSASRPLAITIKSLTPASATPGDTVGILYTGSNLEAGHTASLGIGVTIRDVVYFGKDATTSLDQWVATAEVAVDAPIGDRIFTASNVANSGGTLNGAFEIKDRVSDLCAPIELVAPAAGSTWVFSQTSEDGASGIADPAERQRLLGEIRARRSRLQDDLLALSSLKDEHKSKWKELDRVARELYLAESTSWFNDNARRLTRRAAREKDVRDVEVRYIKAASSLMDSFSEAESALLAKSLLGRATCLATRAAGALDESRKYHFTSSPAPWSWFGQQHEVYAIHHESLVHTLNALQSINAMRLMAAQRALGARRAQPANRWTAGPPDPATLRPYQRRLRDVYLDLGVGGVMLTEVQAEAAMVEQDSYFAGVYATHRQSQGVESAATIRGEAAQALIFSLKYLLAGGTSLFGAALDGVKRFFNFIPSATFDVTLFDTLSSEISKQIKDSRQKTTLALNTLERIRGYSDERSRQLVTVTDEGTQYLTGNRMFVEQTSGGLRRMAAAYITDLTQMANEELLMAAEHGALVAADMERAFNSRVGAEATGDIPYKKVLADPIGIARIAIQDTSWGGDHFGPTIEYVAKRKAQVQEMETVRQALEKVEFDELALRRKLPRTYAVYLELEADHPDFLQWTLVRSRLAAQRRLDLVEAKLGQTYDPNERLELEQIAARNRGLILMQATDRQARIAQLQGADKLMVWDYEGALECFYQAAEWNPKIQPLERVESLRQALGWQKTVDAGIEVATQVGNLAVQTALFEFLGQSIGQILKVPAARAAGIDASVAERSIWTRPLRGMDFADFVWRQFNPFADFVKAGLVEQTWAKMGEATLAIGQNVATQVVQVDLIKKDLLQGYFGLDDQWADVLANALVATSQVKLGSGNSVLTEVAGWLRDVNAKFDFHIVDVPLWNERQQARRSLSQMYEWMHNLEVFENARKTLNGKTLGGQSDEQVKAATEPAAEAARRVAASLEPLTAERLQRLYDEHFPGDGKPMTPAERIAQIKKFFAVLDWKHGIMALKLVKGAALNRQVDELRRELVATVQAEFLTDPRFAKFREYILDYLYIGSAGNKRGAAYKLTDSDIDFTVLVKSDIPESLRNEIRESFLTFFQEVSGKHLEAFEMSIMVDPMPKFEKARESAQGLLESAVNEPDPAKRAANRDRLRAEILKNLEQLAQNASDKERYLDRGNLLRHNLFIRLGCFLKRAVLQRTDGTELVDESPDKYDELYGDVPLESWMALDAVIGNLGYIAKHAAEHPNDNVAYQKVLGGKYAIRGALFSMLLMSPKARERLSKLSRAEVESRGWEGPERIVVEIAREILSQPDGMKEMGLPTTLTEPGQEALVMSAADWMQLFEEWNRRKEGLPLEEVFGSPGRPATPTEVNVRLQKNIVRTEALFKAALRKTILEQGTELMKLRNARKDALAVGDTTGAELFDLKMKEIVLSQAAVWNRMSREQQNLVLKELPPEADWWVGIAAVEHLKDTAARPAPTPAAPQGIALDPFAVGGWQPRVILDDPAGELQKRITQLQQRAKTSPTPTVLNSTLTAIGNRFGGG